MPTTDHATAPAVSPDGNQGAPSARQQPAVRRTPALRESGASRAIEVIGDAWVLRLLRSAFRGQRHFAGFLRELGVSRAVLVDRLARMVGDELLERRIGRTSLGAGSSIEYRLTDRALDLWPLLLAMWQWERHWGSGLDPEAREEDRPRARLVHRGCGRTMEPLCVCGGCQQAVSPFDTEAVEPSATAEGAQGQSSSGSHLESPLEAERGADLEPSLEAHPVTGPEGNLALTLEADSLARRQASQTLLATALPPRKRYRKSHGTDRSILPTLMRAYGDRWNSALLASALQGARTFSDFQRLTAIGTTQLADRLVELQAMELLRPRPYAGSRQTYHLTRRAIATYPITLEMMRWGDRWLWQGHSPLPVRHRPCGAILQTQWRCGHCQLPLERTELSFDTDPQVDASVAPSRSGSNTNDPGLDSAV